MTTKYFRIFFPSKMKASDAVSYILSMTTDQFVNNYTIWSTNCPWAKLFISIAKTSRRSFELTKDIAMKLISMLSRSFERKIRFFLFTTVALAAVCLRCVCVARYRTTNESSSGRGKMKGLQISIKPLNLLLFLLSTHFVQHYKVCLNRQKQSIFLYKKGLGSLV